tara:strand:- start:35 stop:529 length:495 start_codon:yes stop_codon:yes gene_type:complete
MALTKKQLMKRYKGPRLILAILLILYCIINVKLPMAVAEFSGSILGMILIFIIIILAFYYEDVIIGILVLLAGIVTIMRSPTSPLIPNIQNQILTNPLSTPNSDKFVDPCNQIYQYSQMNQFNPTLEEEMVGKMIPLVRNPNTEKIATHNYNTQKTHTKQAAKV